MRWLNIGCTWNILSIFTFVELAVHWPWYWHLCLPPCLLLWIQDAGDCNHHSRNKNWRDESKEGGEGVVGDYTEVFLNWMNDDESKVFNPFQKNALLKFGIDSYHQANDLYQASFRAAWVYSFVAWGNCVTVSSLTPQHNTQHSHGRYAAIFSRTADDRRYSHVRWGRCRAKQDDHSWAQ